MTLDPSTGFTCVTCRLVFKSAEVQRDHYRTDWHRYNLKRQSEQIEESISLFCSTCRKQMKSKNAFNNHIISKKHKEMENRDKKGPKQPKKKLSTNTISHSSEDKAKEDNDSENDSSSDWETDNESDDDIDFHEDEAIPVTSCLFCPQTKTSKEASLQHMWFHHGFAFPDKQYLVDEEGLLKYLGMKVGAGRCCIFCPDRRSRFNSVTACQAHMRDKEHCKVPRDSESMLEFAEYYDYSPMYSNEEDEKSDILYDDGWSLTLPSGFFTREIWIDLTILYINTSNIVGAKIGHRSLMCYYRQYLRPVDNTKRDIGRAALDKGRGLYSALTWTGTNGELAKQVARDLKFVQRYRRRFDLRVGVRSNKLFKTAGRVGDN
uniref:C2H2-type domain-containing protein n=1 Tax=Heterorhabditis bacteriophora TaxID=37862 RepID=A0A1I7XJU7_HETBA